MNYTGLSSAMKEQASTNLYLFVKLKMFHPLFYIVSSTKEIQFTKSNKNVMFSLSFFSFIIHRAKISYS